MSIAGGLPRAVDRAVATGCETAQIFTKSSNQWRARPLSETEVSAFTTRVRDTGVTPMVAHASYLINLASPSTQLRRRSIAALEEELNRADVLGLAGVILHPGAHTTSTVADGLRRIAECINHILTGREAGSALLLLEQTAGQGTVLGHRFEQLRWIIDQIEANEHVGVCLDTCHLVGAGYDIITADGQRRVLDEFDATIGFHRLKAMHLNDSKKPLGSRLDRHEHIGKGCIGTEAFGRLLKDQRLVDVPMLLETPKQGGRGPAAVDPDPWDLDNLSLLRRLRERQP